MAELMAAGEPVIGFEIGGGQFEYVDDDGVSTGPIVSVGLTTRDGDTHRYTLHPLVSMEMGHILEVASRDALQDYYKKEAQRERRHRRIANAVVAVVFLANATWAGFDTATRSYPAYHGNWVDGALAAVNMIFQMIGVGLVAFFAMKQIHKLRRHKKVSL